MPPSPGEWRLRHPRRRVRRPDVGHRAEGCIRAQPGPSVTAPDPSFGKPCQTRAHSMRSVKRPLPRPRARAGHLPRAGGQTAAGPARGRAFSCTRASAPEPPSIPQHATRPSRAHARGLAPPAQALRGSAGRGVSSPLSLRWPMTMVAHPKTCLR